MEKSAYKINPADVVLRFVENAQDSCRQGDYTTAYLYIGPALSTAHRYGLSAATWSMEPETLRQEWGSLMRLITSKMLRKQFSELNETLQTNNAIAVYEARQNIERTLALTKKMGDYLQDLTG
jgi:hypothetical protein